MPKHKYSLPLLQSCSELATCTVAEDGIFEATRRCMNIMRRDAAADAKCSQLYDYLRSFGELDRQTIVQQLSGMLLVPLNGPDREPAEAATK